MKKKFTQNPSRSYGGDGVERSASQAGQPAVTPFPGAQQPAPNYILPNTANFAVVGNGMPLGLPVYSSVDEYGRIFSPVMSYAPQPNSAPVPIATPSKIIQLSPIVSPVAFVPYATQNQSLYQYDEENN